MIPPAPGLPPMAYLQATSPDNLITDETVDTLPSFDTREKQQLLEYAVCGATLQEACKFVGVRFSTMEYWRRQDADFDSWMKRVPSLRNTLANTIIAARFTRNMFLGMEIDYKLLYRAAIDPDSLSDKEWDFVKSIRRLYGPAELVNIIRVTQPERTDLRPQQVPNLVVHVDGNAVVNIEAQQAASRALLQGFVTSGRVTHDESKVIEGELVDGN